MNVRKLTTLGLLAGLSVLLVGLIHMPIFPGAAFLEYDPGNIPILIATFAYGPVAGLGVTLVTALIQGLTVSAQSGIYGIIMHIIATGTYVLVSGLIYNRKKTRANAAIALVVGAIAMTAVMAVANLVITPMFMNVPVDVVRGMLIPFIIPFNLIKAGVNGLVTFVVYKRVTGIIKGLSETAERKPSIT